MDEGSVRAPGRVGYKWAMDIVGASLALILALPLMVLVAIMVKLDSPGPVIYRQVRLGRNGKSFEIFKFRTMQASAEGALETHLEGNPSMRVSWDKFQKLLYDPRLTRVGRFLRQYSLDELPQLWNVLRGEMSLVGARPILPEQRISYGPAIQEYIQLRPGLTGLWQVSGRNCLSFAERVRCDQEYFKRVSIWLDVQILIQTARVVLTKEGAF